MHFKMLCLMYKCITESKKTDHSSCSEKDKNWKEMEINFNSICGTGRSNKMLQSKWESLKKTTKKLHGQAKCELYKTGSGPESTVVLKGVSSRVMSIIGIGATGLACVFDSNSIITDLTEESRNEPATVVDTVAEKEVEEMPSSQWASWNPNLLRTPVHKKLRTSSSIHTYNETTEVPISSINETNKKLKTRKLSIGEQLKYKRTSQSSIYDDLAKKKWSSLISK